MATKNGLLKGINEHNFVLLTEQQVEVFIRPEELVDKVPWVQCIHCGLVWQSAESWQASMIGCWEEQRSRKQALIDGDDAFIRPIVVKAVSA